MQRKHLNPEKEVQCRYCLKMLSANVCLVQHIDALHPEKSSKPLIFSCSKAGCKAVFPSSKLLMRHERKHNKLPMESKCPVCGGTYESLVRHIRNSHPEIDHYAYLQNKPGKVYKHKEPPIQCDLCGKTFTRVAAMKAHKNAIHQHIRHKCPSCDKDYASVGDMRCHFRAVHEGVTWPCRFCSVIFLRGSQRNQHEKREHPDLVAGGAESTG